VHQAEPRHHPVSTLLYQLQHTGCSSQTDGHSTGNKSSKCSIPLLQKFLS
jgi:hypothetical protein